MTADSSPLSVAHLDADAFYVSIELLRRPELRGQPVVVAGAGPRAVVTTASYEARRYGVGSAMPAARARRLCPQAVFLTPDFPAYREVSARLMDRSCAHVERVEVVGLDEAYLDLEGLYSPRAAMRRLLAEIRQATGLTLLGRHRPEQARREGGLRRGEAGRLRRAEPRAGVRPLRRLAARARAGHRAEDRRAPGRARAEDPCGGGPGARAALVERFGPNLGRELGRRARFEHGGEVALRARSSRSRASERSTATSTIPRSCARR